MTIYEKYLELYKKKAEIEAELLALKGEIAKEMRKQKKTRIRFDFGLFRFGNSTKYEDTPESIQLKKEYQLKLKNLERPKKMKRVIYFYPAKKLSTLQLKK